MYIVRDIYINVKLSQLIGPKFVKMLMKDRNARCTYTLYMDALKTETVGNHVIYLSR